MKTVQKSDKNKKLAKEKTKICKIKKGKKGKYWQNFLKIKKR